MTKKPPSTAPGERQLRRQQRLEEREREQRRRVFLAVGGVIGLIVLVLLVAVVNEFVLKPSQPVAVVNGEPITTREWQRRVRYQRAQFISTIEEFYENTGGNVGLVQQLLGQQMQLLLDPQQLGGLVLDNMIDERLIQAAARDRGITVTDAEVQDTIESQYNYFDGGLPTPFPTGTATIMPTPSLTPIPTAVITDVLPTATPLPSPTIGPTVTPPPTATPVSQEAFDELFGEQLGRLRRLGGSEAELRSVVRAQLYRERLTEALAAELEVSTEEEQATFFVITFTDEVTALAGQDEAAVRGYVDFWNRVRSTPPDASETSPPVARELIWRNRAQVEQALGTEAAEAAFGLDLNTISGLLVQEQEVPAVATGADGEDAEPTITRSYHLIFVTGRETRPLSAGALDQAQAASLSSWLDTQRAANSETFERWTTRVPTQPELDLLYLQAPTPVPTEPLPPAPIQPTVVVPTP